MSDTQENAPAQSVSVSVPIDNGNTGVPLASRQINNVIEFQEPSTSKNYSFKTEIRINIMGEPKNSNKSIASDDSVTLSLFNDDNKVKKDPMEIEDSFATMDACVKEKAIGTISEPVVMFSRNERTQRAIVTQSEAPPPYDSQPPPAYWGPYRSGNVQPLIPSQQAQQPPSRGWGSNNPDSDLLYGEIAFSLSFDDIAIRHAFVQKVFAILFVQLLITSAIILFVMLHKPTKIFVRDHPIILFLMLFLFLITYLSLICLKSLRRAFPLNYIFLFLLTISLSYIGAATTTIYSTNIVLSAVAGTGIICLTVSLLAFQTWFDITKWSFILTIAGLILMIFGIVATILLMLGYKTVWIIYCGLAVVLFSVFLLYDMQCILGGRRVELSPEEYIYGALTIYMDIIMIFYYLMQFLAFCGN